jgi:hypothetical protein
MDTLLSELLRASTSAIVGVIVAALLGQRVAAYWATRQKRRELAITAANEFYRLYGEFFAIWKLWNFALKSGRDPEQATARRWELLERATAAEAGVEAALVRLSVERRLDEGQLAAAARFRQGYQTLREAIRSGEPIRWGYSEHPEYVAFKRLATEVANLISSAERGRTPTAAEAQAALIEITANKWEADWSGTSSTERVSNESLQLTSAGSVPAAPAAPAPRARS